MEGKYVLGIMTVFVSVILVGSVLAPVIDNVSGGSWDEEITTVFNEDPDLTFTKQTSSFALDMSVTIDGSEITIVNGTDTITASYGIMFLYAADNSAVFINTADDLILTWSDTDGSYSVNLAGSFTAAIADGKLTVDDGTAYDVPLPASYLYVPSSTGGYGSFPSGELAKRAEDPVIAAGSFAGAVGYNASVTYVGDAARMDYTGTDTEITSVQWVRNDAADPAVIDFDPSTITIQPLDPAVIDDPEPGIQAVPTPTYTDGDWGYDLYTSGSNNGKAKIVSYSGSGGTDIVIPATVGGYEVVTVGKGSGGAQVFDSSVNINGLIFSEGIKTIEWYAFNGCSGLSGHISLSSTITTIGNYSFGYTAIESIDMPESVTTIGNGAFNYCASLKNVVVPASVTSIGGSAFSQTYTGDGLDTLVILGETVTMGSNVTNGNTFKNLVSLMGSNSSLSSTAFTSPVLLKEVLNLGSLELTTTSYGLNADAVQDYIDAEAYLAPATLTYTIHHSGSDGSLGAMYAAIPVVILIAILLAAVSMFLIRRAD